MHAYQITLIFDSWRYYLLFDLLKLVLEDGCAGPLPFPGNLVDLLSENCLLLQALFRNCSDENPLYADHAIHVRHSPVCTKD